MKTCLVILFCLMSVIVYCQDKSLTNVADGQEVSLKNYTSSKAIVVIFTSNVCAYDGYYTERLKSFFSTYKANVQFILVNSYIEPEESADKMKAKYATWGFDVPYLADKDQSWMKALNARKSPEVFVLDPGLKVLYSGAIDDNPQLANGVKESYLKKVLDAVIAGKQYAATDMRAVGCSIRFK